MGFFKDKKLAKYLHYVSNKYTKMNLKIDKSGYKLLILFRFDTIYLSGWPFFEIWIRIGDMI
jgi:hypothetical protein